MKRKLKGFTLIECIIAMFILAVSSLLLVQAYTQLVTVTRENYTRYNSIGRQMEDAENTDYAEGKLTDDPKDVSVQAKKIDEAKTLTFNAKYPNSSSTVVRTISEEVYVYVVTPFDMQGNQLPTGAGQGSGGTADSAQGGTDSRYMYFHQ
ncbi:MAG: prepilin-type N-terminal cleavage/methylation domain-containing protein [Oscillospiraceae bacterium]|nr:prepilin-type N-terminal cleavage/methylation domain-containing protein [Oscillospiraceae bacterium]